ncbi:MAG: prepilin-type N-terminal cleavage/methylation domain-containing protein [Acetivibrio sp.]
MNMEKNKGLTLIELIIAMAVGGLLILAITTFMEWGSKGFQNTQQELDVQMETQMLVNLIGDRILEGNHIEFSKDTMTIYAIKEAEKTITEKKIIWLDTSTGNLYLFETSGNPTLIVAPDPKSLLAQNVESFFAIVKESKVTLSLTLHRVNRSFTLEQEVKMRNKQVPLP